MRRPAAPQAAEEGCVADVLTREEPVAAAGRGRERVLRLARRVSWNLLDQLISSVTNAALSLTVARTVDKASFGGFAVAFTIFQLTILVARALLGQPLTMRFSGTTSDRRLTAARGATGGALLVGCAAGLCSALTGLLVDDQLRPVLLAMAVGLPALVLQDTWRLLFFTELRPAKAAFNDALWALVQAPLIAAAILTDQRSATPFVLAWAFGAVVAALVGMRQAGVRPSVGRPLRFLAEQWDISRYLLAEQALGQGAYQGALLLVGVRGTLADVGSLRGAMVLLSPVGILALSVSAFAIPELARRTGLSTADYNKAALLVSGTLMAASTIWVSIFLLLPATAGEAILGDSWSGARSVLLPSLLYQLALCAGAGPSLVIYALANTRSIFRISLIGAALLIVGAVVGADLDGARGAAYGMGIAATLVTPLSCQRLQTVLRGRLTEPVPAPR